MHSYIAQVTEYHEYFADSTNRTRVAEKFGVEIHAAPDVLIIAGRDSTVEAVEVHQHCRRQSIALEIQTYDQVLAALERAHAAAFGPLENVGGLTFFSQLRFHRDGPDRTQCLAEVWGDDGAACRIALEPTGHLVLTVTEPGGVDHRTAARMDRDDLSDWFVLSYEIGSDADGTLLQLRAEDRIVATQRLPKTVVAVALDHGTLGSARYGADGAAFDLAEHIAYSKVLAFRDRLQLFAYLLEKRASGLDKWVEFGGEQWLGLGGADKEQPPER